MGDDTKNTPGSLADILAQGAASQPIPIFPDQNALNAPPPDIAAQAQTPNYNLPTGGQAPQQPASNAPPQMGGMPLVVRYISDMIKGGQQANPLTGQGGYSRGDATLNFLGEFLQNMSAGFAAAGLGPGANMRGFAAAATSPYQRALQTYGLQQQQQAQQSQLQSEAVRRQMEEAQIKQMQNVVQTPYGPMSSALASKIWPAEIARQGKIEAAGVQKRYMTTPLGIFDTQDKKFVEGGTNGIKVTDELAKDYGLPKDLVGREIPLQQFSSMERGGAAIAANQIRSRQADIAAGRLSLANKAFERDTFGTLMGQNIPSSLVDDNGTTMGWKSPSMPTSSIKTQGQQAEDLSVLFKTVSNKIDQLDKAGKLGPLAGRINEFMTGKVGADDPEFAELRALGSLTASGMLKAHFGSRGGQQMYQHFEDLFNTGKMTAGDLKAALGGFETFMDKYAGRVKKAGPGGPSSGGNALSRLEQKYLKK